VGVQIPCGVHSEVPEKNVVFPTEAAFGRSVSPVGATQGMSGSGRALDARSCAYADSDSAEVCGIASSGVHEGEKCDSCGSCVWRAQAQLCRSALLGEDTLYRRSGETKK